MAERDAVDRGIVARDVDRLAVDVGRDAPGFRPQLERRECQQPGAGTDVGDVGEARAPALELVERGETAAGGRMLPGPERKPGVNLEIDPAAVGRIGRCVNGKAAGADRLQPGLAHRHPILLTELVDLRRPAAEAGQQRDLIIARMVLEISVDEPIVGFARLRLVSDQHGRVIAREQFARVGKGFGLGSRTRNRDAEAHGVGGAGAAASFATRLSSCLAKSAA